MARPKKAKSSSKTPAPAFDEAYWTKKLEAFFSSPAEALAFKKAAERQWSEEADALAADIAARLDVEPTVVRSRLRTLFNDLHELNDEPNDWMNETQRTKAKARIVAAFTEKLEDFSPAVKASQQSRKRRPEIEARRVELDALIRAEVDAAKATVQREWPDTPPQQEAVNREIADTLERQGVRVDGKRIGTRRIEQARKGR